MLFYTLQGPLQQPQHWLLSKVHQGFCQGCSSFDGFDSQKRPLLLLFKGGGGLQQVEGTIDTSSNAPIGGSKFGA